MGENISVEVKRLCELVVALHDVNVPSAVEGAGPADGDDRAAAAVEGVSYPGAMGRFDRVTADPDTALSKATTAGP